MINCIDNDNDIITIYNSYNSIMIESKILINNNNEKNEKKFDLEVIEEKSIFFLLFNLIYMKSYLSPDKYFEDYAECLGVEVEFLQNVGELCEKPDIEKETLIIKEEEKEIIN